MGAPPRARRRRPRAGRGRPVPRPPLPLRPDSGVLGRGRDMGLFAQHVVGAPAALVDDSDSLPPILAYRMPVVIVSPTTKASRMRADSYSTPSYPAAARSTR